MRSICSLALLVASPLLLLPSSLTAQKNADATSIRAVMDKQVADWNRGDIDAFATGYKNSPDILFMGAEIHHGYAEMVAHYKANYSTRAKMGTLSFSDLDIQPLDAHFATATGRFRLVRSQADAGDAAGFYLLVFEKTPEGWKIVRDDTTDQAKPAAR